MISRIIIAKLILTVVAFAQAPPAFEVVSIRISPPRQGTARLSAMDTDAAMVRYTNLSLRILISIAYRFDSEMIKGGAGGVLDEERYDLAAKLPAGASKDRVPEMLQLLLAERLKLAVHRETKEERIYFLVTGKNGPKLKKANEANAADPDHMRGDRTPAGQFPGGLTGRAIPIGQLAGMLSRVVGRQVIDHTALTGKYDVDLRWRPNDTSTNGADVFTAIQEQLGLRLEPGTGPVEALIVDHVERIPIDN